MLGLVGVIAIETSVGLVPLTVSEAEPLIEFKVAEMVAVPGPELVARPWVPDWLLTMASVAAEELQVTTEVKFCVLLSA